MARFFIVLLRYKYKLILKTVLLLSFPPLFAALLHSPPELDLIAQAAYKGVSIMAILAVLIWLVTWTIWVFRVADREGMSVGEFVRSNLYVEMAERQ